MIMSFGSFFGGIITGMLIGQFLTMFVLGLFIAFGREDHATRG